MSQDHRARPRPWPRRPLLATLMAQPVAIRLLALLLALHFGLMSAGFSGWSCPVYALLQFPCPGCGLSRSMVEFCRAEPTHSLELHAFGPLAGLALVLLLLSSFLTPASRQRFIHAVEQVEVTTGVTHVCLLLFFVYWVVRLVAGHGSISSLA